MYNFSKLRGRIVEQYGSQGAFACAVHRSQAYVSGVLNGKAYLEHRDIDLWAEMLSIPGTDLATYFFTRI